MNDNQKLTVGWCLTIVIVLIALFSIASCTFADKEELVREDPKTVFGDSNLTDRLVEDDYESIFKQHEFVKYGYSSMAEWWADIELKHKNAQGISNSIIEMFADVITDEQKAKLIEYEEIMTTTRSLAEYYEALDAFDAIYYECDAALSALLANKNSSSVSSYNDGGFDIPYNFKVMGVLYDSKYRYTYYSSNVLYHYRTPEWTLGSDGIYRDSAGRVVVASDDYPEGTVVYSELFGDCIVLDCGVGTSGTLDVYVGW